MFLKKQNYDSFKLEFFIKIKENSKITSLLIHGCQWTATLKPNYFSKKMFNSDVTLKVTLSFLNLVLKFQSYLIKKFKIKLLLEKFHLSAIFV